MPVTVRVCDVALKTLAVLVGQPFSFRLEGSRPCTHGEQEEGNRFMAKRGR